jgi:hypothetical protein
MQAKSVDTQEISATREVPAGGSEEILSGREVLADKFYLPTFGHRFVMDRLVEAGVTVPCVKSWRSVPRELADQLAPIAASMLALGRLLTAAKLWPEPSADRVSRMIEAFGWLDLVSDDDRRIIMSRVAMAPGAPHPIVLLLTLARGLGLTQGQVAYRFDRAIRLIAARFEEAQTTA